MTHSNRIGYSRSLNPGLCFTMATCAAALLGCGGYPKLQACAESDNATGLLTKSPTNETQDDPSFVKTANGFIRGNVEAAYRRFLGIPYAAAPIGALRWKPPIPAPSWLGVRDASLPKGMCPQSTYTGPDVKRAGGNEDCLFLNVTTPNKPSLKDLPVMVWIHGGGYVGGSGSGTDGISLIQRADIIVVTLNYRLGALGFLAHPALTAESRDSSGNFGLLDQQAALVWVKENIAQFGGDPNNVTIFGESSGGNSVWAHMISPKSAELFQRAISMSGLWSTCWNWQGYGEQAQPFSLSNAEATGKRFADALGCTGSGRAAARCLRNATVADLVEVGEGEVNGKVFNWGPTTGGAVLPRQLKEALAAGKFNQVPIINGSTHDEAMPYAMMPFYLYTNNPLTPEVYMQTLLTRFGQDASTVQARYSIDAYGSAPDAYAAVDTDLQNACYTRTVNKLAAAYTSVYAYEFNDRNAPSSWEQMFNGFMPFSPGAYHGSDCQYIFSTANNTGVFTPEQSQLSDRMIEYFTSFAAAGTPQSTIPWLPYDPRLDAVQSLAPDAIEPTTGFASDHQCAFWAELRGI